LKVPALSKINLRAASILFLPLKGSVNMCDVKNCKKKIRVYVSGAITNNPNHKLNFDKVHDDLINKGFLVLSPVCTTAYTMKKNDRECFLEAIKLLFNADIMVQINDPATSEGMRIEAAIDKRLNIKYKIIF
jgi:hypothetical protein